VQGFIFEGDLQFSKLFKMIFVYHTEFKGSPAYDTPNGFYSTSFKNYPSFSLQVPSILSILLGERSHDESQGTDSPLSSSRHREGMKKSVEQ
jgi:hypothetical protein